MTDIKVLKGATFEYPSNAATLRLTMTYYCFTRGYEIGFRFTLKLKIT